MLIPESSGHRKRGRGKSGSCRALGALAETDSGTAPSRLAGSSQALDAWAVQGYACKNCLRTNGPCGKVQAFSFFHLASVSFTGANITK